MKRLLTLALLITGCGDLNVDAKGATKAANEAPDAARPETGSETPKKPEAKPAAASASATATATATCSASGQAAPAAGSTLDWRYVPALKTYADAVAEAPDGFHLPTRGNLIDGVDSGALKGYTDSVWSATGSAGREDHVWTIRLNDGYQIDTWKEALHQTIYVREIGD